MNNMKHLRWRAYNDQNGLCYWCNRAMSIDEPHDPFALSSDYLVPLHAGGKTEIGNIIAVHRKCNNSICGRPKCT